MLPLRAVAVALAMAGVAAPAADPPERLHVVLNARSDAAPFWARYLMELRRPGPGAWELRWSRIAPTNSLCPRIDVKSDSRQLTGDAVKAVFENVNPCSVRPKEIERVSLKDRQVDLLEHPVDFVIVAECAGETKILEAPHLPWEKAEELRRKRHIFARLRDLYWDLSKAAGYGDRSPFADLDDDEDLQLQGQGEAIVPELRSGRYDVGLGYSWAKTLERYNGPRHPAELRPKPRLLRESSSEGVELAGPDLEYPPLAKAARIQGRVTVRYEVESGTGRIQSIEQHGSTGHPLLVPAAEAGLKGWRVTNHADIGPGPFQAEIEYDLDDLPGCRQE